MGDVLVRSQSRQQKTNEITCGLEQQAIANIIIWHKGEKRAPHKPLLLLTD